MEWWSGGLAGGGVLPRCGNLMNYLRDTGLNAGVFTNPGHYPGLERERFVM